MYEHDDLGLMLYVPEYNLKAGLEKISIIHPIISAEINLNEYLEIMADMLQYGNIVLEDEVGTFIEDNIISMLIIKIHPVSIYGLR